MNDQDLEYIRLAIEEAAKSRNEDDRSHPKVGAVVVKDGKVLATAHRGELNAGEHAEFTALEKKLTDSQIAGATVYTTLEPCTTRNHPKIPCAHRLIERRIRRVVIGMLDPDERICGRGLWHLRDSGIATDLFTHEQMSAVEELNREFIRLHRPTRGRNPAVAAPPSEVVAEGNPELLLFDKLFSAAHNRDFSAAEVALKELQAKPESQFDGDRLQLLFWHLKAQHGSDRSARTEIEKRTSDETVGQLATELLVSLETSAGNVDGAVAILNKALQTAPGPDAKAALAIKLAFVYRDGDESDRALEVLRSVLSLELTPTVKAQVLRAMAEFVTGSAASHQKAALLIRAATLDPTAKGQFAAAYSLGEAGLPALAALHYECALSADPNDTSSMNNLGAAFEEIGMPGMAVRYYRDAVEKGETLAMANLAQRHISAGFFDAADELIKKARTAESPHENVGNAMIKLAKARRGEADQWAEARKTALGQKRLFNDLAEALTSVAPPGALVGPWHVGTSAPLALEIVGSAARAAWEDSERKRRLNGSIVGRAIIGTLEEWNGLWENYESKGSICLTLRDDGTLSGFALSTDGTVHSLSWRKEA